MLDDFDGEPLHYHVEFLGETHCHAWVSARSVDLFGGPEREDEEGTDKGESRGRTKAWWQPRKVAIVMFVILREISF